VGTEVIISTILVKLNSLLKKISAFFSPIIKRVFVLIKNFFGKTGLFVEKVFTKARILFRLMKKWEKITVLALLIVALTSLSIIFYTNYIKNTQSAPAYGGIYTEGIVADNKIEIENIIQKLTKIGLTYYDSEQKIMPALAEKWEISEDSKIYTFYLRAGIDSKAISDAIKSKKNVWADVQIDTPEVNIIKFTLKDKFSPFLASTTQEFFDFGPYILTKQDKSELVFEGRTDFIFGKPNIKEIVLKLYPDAENLEKALKQNKIMGAVDAGSDELKNINSYSLTLPRYLVLFFNLNRDQFQDKSIRQKIKNDENLGKEINVNLVTVDRQENIDASNGLKSKWDAIGLKVDIKTYDQATLQNDIIPNRNYDMLLYGIDYGYDPDPYPFWHTSQMTPTGLNLSNFSNPKADGFLEEGRQTLDEKVRAEKYQEFQKIFDDEVPAIVLEQYSSSYVVSNKIKGIKEHFGVDPSDRFSEIWLWYTKEKRVKK
jgi:ABC-type transport system substrate-binding protein